MIENFFNFSNHYITTLINKLNINQLIDDCPHVIEKMNNDLFKFKYFKNCIC